MHLDRHFLPLPQFRPSRLLLLAAVLVGAPLALGQGWYREAFLPPTSAATFAENSKQTAGAIRLGPVVVDVSAQALLEHSTNILLAPQPEEGLTLGYGLTFDAVWVAAEMQQLKLTGELTRRQTLRGPGRDRTFLFLAPGSALRYTVYVKSIRITPFLNLSRQMDPVTAPTINNTDVFEQNARDLGLQVDWPLNDLTLQLMALRGRKTSASGFQEKSTVDRQVLSARLLRTFTSTLDAGIDAFIIEQDYVNGPSRASTQETASVFGRWAISKSLQLRGGAGYHRFDFQGGSLFDDLATEAAAFTELELSHKLRRNLSYSLRYVRSVNDGVTSNFYRLREISLNPKLQLNARTTVLLEAGLQRIEESLASGETGRRRNLGARIEVNLPHNLILRAGVRDLVKTSTLASRAYRQRNTEISLRKQF